ncbi:hypothetical protein [Roseovarius pacificus]|uniref:hypothetical protein n=1 Tax=Roseovarius pacificus TaxID=337701 RepID=UPI000934CA7A|nr:hypothetical protein [Roseovarius pacificus]GGO58511.1 hypothetical protein GCM10011315_28250 [Roseovarius pacificus]
MCASASVNAKLNSCGAAGTAELFFDEVRVPVSNLIGDENKGFGYLMTQLAQERLTVAISAIGWA